MACRQGRISRSWVGNASRARIADSEVICPDTFHTTAHSNIQARTEPANFEAMPPECNDGRADTPQRKLIATRPGMCSRRVSPIPLTAYPSRANVTEGLFDKCRVSR